MKRLRIECDGPGWKTIVTDPDTGNRVDGVVVAVSASLNAGENWSNVEIEYDGDGRDAFLYDLEEVEVHFKAARRIDVKPHIFDYMMVAKQGQT